MQFPTGLFALFFATVFALHWALRRHPVADRLVLLGASLVFYGAWDWRFCFLLVGVALWAWVFGLVLGARPRGRAGIVLPLAVAGPLLVLAYFKYAGFFVAEFGRLLIAFGMAPPEALDIILPVGVSFFVFQAISYIVDVYRCDAAAETSPLNVVVYITFFPHLAAGPIVRAAHFVPQVAAPPDPTRIPFVMASLLILGGLFKKVVLANEIGTGVVDPVFRDPAAHGALDAWLAVYGYAAQIWCDFSAYSDIAIGCAALLGYHFPRNFDQPYRAATLSDFWRRWHISLSSFLRDYLYVPLGGDRCGKRRTAINLMLVMGLGGLWHGASWTFLAWGLLHGGGLVMERVLGWRSAAGLPGHVLLLRGLVVFHLVCAGWILFRAADLGVAGGMFSALLRFDVAPEAATLRITLLCAFALGLHLLPGDWTQRLERALAPLPAPALGIAFGLFLLAVLAAGPEGVAPFIYFQF